MVGLDYHFCFVFAIIFIRWVVRWKAKLVVRGTGYRAMSNKDLKLKVLKVEQEVLCKYSLQRFR